MDSLLQDLVTAEAEHHWDDDAIVADGAAWTYGDVETRSDQLANVLRESGCGRGDRVAMFAPPSGLAVVAMLGIFKADCTYVPVDCSRPIADLLWIVQACQPRVLLTAASTASLLSEVLLRDPRQLPRTVGSLEAHALETPSFRTAFCFAEVEGLSVRRLAYRNWPADTAYVQFSPCATGVPKGVVVSHDACGRFLRWATRYFGVLPGDRQAAYVPLSSDLAIYDALSALAGGGTIFVSPAPGATCPADLAAFIRERRLTQWCASQDTLAWMAEAKVVELDDFPSLKRVIWSDDVVSLAALRYWMARMPHTLFSSLQGFLPAGTIPGSDARGTAEEWPTSDSPSSAMRARLPG
jgi:non-ribosomal peptide synthetase component F